MLCPGRTLQYVAADIGTNPSDSGLRRRDSSLAALALRVMTVMRDQGAVAFIGPDDTCGAEGLVAAAWNLPIIAYVSTPGTPLILLPRWGCAGCHEGRRPATLTNLLDPDYTFWVAKIQKGCQHGPGACCFFKIIIALLGLRLIVANYNQTLIVVVIRAVREYYVIFK